MSRPDPGSSFVIGALCACLGTPHSGMAGSGDEDEKMMWRGTISMSQTEWHRFDISKTAENGARREENRNEEWRQIASVQVRAADIFVSGDIEASGSLRARINDRNLRQNHSARGEWSRTRETRSGRASARLTGKHLMITVTKKRHLEAGKAIQQQMEACGVDPACMARVLQQFSGLVEDKVASFPIKMFVQVFPPCPRASVESTETTDSYSRVQGRETKTDGPHTLSIDVCRPMAFEMDGIYTRGEKGDKITANLSDTDRPDYKAWDDKNHPREIMARCNITLSNGPPEVRIYADTNEGEKDITDEETEIMVGQRIMLAAHVVSHGMGDETLQSWLVPGGIFEEWYGSEERTIFTPVKEFEDRVIEFAWKDGSTGGTRREVKYWVDYSGAELKGKTTFKVFTPSTSTQVAAARDIVFGLGEDGCEILPEPPSIRIESTVTMPDNTLNIGRFRLAYAQLVDSNVWGLARIRPIYEWRFDHHTWLLDESFPYNGYHDGSGSTTFAMQDAPGVPLSNLDALYADMKFKAYLLFRPPPHPELVAYRTYVPLKKVDWRWKGSAVARIAFAHYPNREAACGTSHIIDCRRPPSVYPHRAVDATHHPVWEGVSKRTKLVKSWNEGAPPQSKDARPPPVALWSCN